MWPYTRLERLDALVREARRIEAFLYRERCDAADPAPIDRRLVTVRRRITRLCLAARTERRRARELAAV